MLVGRNIAGGVLSSFRKGAVGPYNWLNCTKQTIHTIMGWWLLNGLYSNLVSLRFSTIWSVFHIVSTLAVTWNPLEKNLVNNKTAYWSFLVHWTCNILDGLLGRNSTTSLCFGHKSAVNPQYEKFCYFNDCFYWNLLSEIIWSLKLLLLQPMIY